jgi:hypothetical protein
MVQFNLICFCSTFGEKLVCLTCWIVVHRDIGLGLRIPTTTKLSTPVVHSGRVQSCSHSDCGARYTRIIRVLFWKGYWQKRPRTASLDACYISASLDPYFRDNQRREVFSQTHQLHQSTSCTSSTMAQYQPNETRFHGALSQRSQSCWSRPHLPALFSSTPP